MPTFLFVITAAYSVWSPSPWARWCVVLVPAYLLLFNCIPMWLQPREISSEKLQGRLADTWKNAAELAGYMRKNWTALEYAPTTGRFASRMSLVSIACFGLALFHAYSGLYVLGGALTCFSIALYKGALDVNRPWADFQSLSNKTIATDSGAVRNLRLAADAIVAYDEMFSKPSQQALVDEILNTQVGRNMIHGDRLKPLIIERAGQKHVL